MDYLQQLIQRYPQLEPIKGDINKAYTILAEAFSNGSKLLIAGNGGSSADAEHITGELMKSFIKKRKVSADFINDVKRIDPETAQYLENSLEAGLPTISLTGHASVNFASINDIDGNITFTQQLYGYGKEGDVFLGISTSGNAKNVYYAAVAAKAKKMKFIALTGCSGGKLRDIADVSIIVPETETYKIQELHLPVYHCLCLMLEDHFF